MIYWVQNGVITEITAPFVEYIFTEYLPSGSLIIPHGYSLTDVDVSKYTHIFVDCCTNPIPYNNGDVNILSSHYNRSKSSTFFPFWTVWASLAYAPAIDNLNYNFFDNDKKYKVSCLNGTPWNHRKLTYLQLSKKDYFKDIVFTFNQRSDYKVLDHEEQLTNSELLEFEKLAATVSFVASDVDAGIDMSLNHPAYQSTLINLVTETTTNIATPFLSEKTFKPIVAGQLFILISAPGAIEFLRSIGIDTFDDIIDHSYDNVIDLRERITLALNQVDQVMQLDHNKLYSKIKSRLLKNSNYFRSQEFRNQFKLDFG